MVEKLQNLSKFISVFHKIFFYIQLAIANKYSSLLQIYHQCQGSIPTNYYYAACKIMSLRSYFINDIDYLTH